MDRTVFILGNIYRLHALAGRILDEEGKPAALPFEGFDEQDPVSGSAGLRKILMEQGRGTTGDGYRVWNDDGYWYYVFHSPEGYVIWGPVVFEEHSGYEQRLYGRRRGLKGAICAVPLTDVRKVEETILFAHGLLLEEYGTKIVINHGMAEERFQRELLTRSSEYELQKAEYNREHHSFAQEHQMWKRLVEGERSMEGQNAAEAEVYNLFEDVTKGAGLMAESPRKNLEYAAVSGITLITRYAMAAGVDENIAYALSDVALQKLSKAADIMEIESTLMYTLQEFMRLGREAGSKSGENSVYVEQSRDYIARHIYEKLSLPEIAGAVGLHPVYLSRIFASQMKMTLMEYVMREKVRISCNLLRYSDRSIAVIAEYVSLSPQSYFTRVFKKVMGETPARYRKSHIDKNFLES